MTRHGVRLILVVSGCTVITAQSWDIGAWADAEVSEQTGGKLKIAAEQRERYESRTGNSFGKDADLRYALARTRLGLAYKPVAWLKLSGMVQDSRAPGYGLNAPNTVRDPFDLHEAYVELFPGAQKGFGLTAGRMMLNYGEGRVLGTPQWGNVARTYDHGRAYWRSGRVQFEVVMLSPVKVRTDAFNQPVLGDRVWGTYNVLPAVIKKTSVEVYILHHDQNRPGGFTSGSWKDGTDRLRTNSFGFRASGPAVRGFKYSIEGVLQNGEIGPAEHKASAWFSSVSRRWKPGSRTLDISGEYKYASGTDNPADTKKSGTYDQLYPANHDKFGHEDLLGWRNLHNARSLAAYGLTKNLTLSVMYDSFWLASPKDGLYSGSGKLIARSSNGTAGRHVGQELDVFGTYKYGRFSFGAGCGRFFAGEFIRATTPGVGPTYMYLFHNYTL